MKKIVQIALAIPLIALLFTGTSLNAQNIGINATGAAPSTGAMLDVSAINKGVLIPRVNIVNLATIAPITGVSVTSLLVYNTNATTGAGYYYWEGTKWLKLTTQGEDWSLTGNSNVSFSNFLGPTNNASLNFRTNNIERMRITSAGNVGIGTTAPIYKLHTIGDIYANGGWLRVSGNKGLFFESHGGGLYMTDNTWIRTYGNKNFYHNIGIMRTDGTFQVGPSGNRFLVKTNGWVGINTTTPANMLQMVNISAVGANAMAGFDNNGADGVALAGSNNGTTNQYNAIEGITAGQWAAGVYGLGISDDNGGAYDAVGVNGHANDWQGIGVYGARSGSGGPNSGWGGLFINDLGYTGWFGSASDKRLKKDIKTINTGLSIVLKLNPVSYMFDTAKYPYMGLNTSLEYGFLAQELEKVLPNIVKEKSLDVNAARPMKANETSKKSDRQIFKMVNYLEIIPITVKAIQEQQKMIAQQNKRIDELEKMVLELKSKQ